MPLADLKEAIAERSPDAVLAVSIADIKELIATNPKHPTAVDYAASESVLRKPDEHIVYVDREDLRGILENRQVIRRRVLEKDELGRQIPYLRKSLGDVVKHEEKEA